MKKFTKRQAVADFKRKIKSELELSPIINKFSVMAGAGDEHGEDDQKLEENFLTACEQLNLVPIVFYSTDGEEHKFFFDKKFSIRILNIST